MHLEDVVPPFVGANGAFVFFPGDPKREKRIWNTITADGADRILRTVFANVAGLLPANWYLGLTNITPDYDVTLAEVAAGEPVGEGYARQAIARDIGSWTIALVNGFYVARSAVVQFEATGTYTQTYSRAFLCNAASGTVGQVFGFSGTTPSPVQVTAGNGPPALYECWIRGGN